MGKGLQFPLSNVWKQLLFTQGVRAECRARIEARNSYSSPSVGIRLPMPNQMQDRANTKTHGHSSLGQPWAQMHYLHLLLMAMLSFISMYVLMYAMVDVVGNVYPNLNQVYMAGLMTAPMIIIELALMGRMYPDQRWNMAIIAASAIASVALFMLIRNQTAIGDKQFLKSMIPHHAGAILMCGEASIEDAEIMNLCKRIIASQQSEIDQMKTILRRIE